MFPVEDPSSSESCSESFNIVLSAAKYSRFKHKSGRDQKTRKPVESELKKLLLQNSRERGLMKISSRVTSTFKRSSISSSSKQHRSKKRFLMELNERLGHVCNRGSPPTGEVQLGRIEVGSSWALSPSLGQLAAFVDHVGSIDNPTGLTESLKTVISNDQAPCVDTRNGQWSYQHWPIEFEPNQYSPMEPVSDFPCSFSNRNGWEMSDCDSNGTRITSPSEFSEISSSDSTFDHIPLSPIDFPITEEDMQKLRDSLCDYNQFDFDFLTPSTYDLLDN